MPMGCYGIGVSRIVAAAIEQNYDERGIVWPANMAPFEVVITPIAYQKSEQVKQACDSLYQTLLELGVDVLLDDRKERPGIMFADADLIGVPHRVVIGDKSLANDLVEYKYRAAETAQDMPLDSIAKFLNEQVLETRQAHQ